MKKKLMKFYDGAVLTYGIIAVIIAIVYLCIIGFVGSDINNNLVRAAVWFGFGLLVINKYIPKKTEEVDNRIYFNQWVEYDTYEDYVASRNGTSSNYSGTIIQTPTSLTISYQDKFGIKSSTYMRTFNSDRADYVGLDDIWVYPLLSMRVIRIGGKIVKLNFNQTLLTQA